MQARWYQTEAVNAIYDFFRRKEGHPLVVVPTGGGKSFIIAEFLRTALRSWPDQKIVVLTHQKELVRQNEEELLRIWPEAPAGVFSAGLNRRELRTITFASIQSIWRYADILDFDLVLIDEAHLVPDRSRSMYRKFLQYVSKPVIGFTATPFRLGTGMLTDGELFTDIAYDCNDKFDRLINEGYLCRLTTKEPATQVNVEDINIRAGEFVPQQLREVVDREEITNGALAEVLEYKDLRKRWLVFAIDIEHAEHVNDWLNEHGILSAVVHSRMDDDRDQVLIDAKAGKYQALVNVNTLTTGYNDPTIDLIVLLRPTASPVLHVQMIGRGLRVAPEKTDCLILDFAGNTHRLGPINNVRMGPKKKGDGTGKPITKTCPECSSIIHAALKFCPDCGHEFIFQEKISQSSNTGQVIQLEAVYRLPERIEVDAVSYSRHVKRSTGSESLKITYKSGLLTYSEWVSFKARYMADYWWSRRAGTQPPLDVAEALSRVDELNEPVAIKVDLNGKYPKIVDVEFDTEKHPTNVVVQRTGIR